MNVSGVSSSLPNGLLVSRSSEHRRPITTTQASVHPTGKQNLSLSSPPEHKLCLSKSTLKHKKSSKSENATTIGYVFAKASYLTLLGMKLVKFGRQAETGSYSAPNEVFKRSFKAFAAINIAFDGLYFIKSAGKTIYHAFRDIGAYKDRERAQALLTDYNPETRTLASRNVKKPSKAELRKLLAKSNSNLSRSKGQVALDRLSETAALSKPATSVAFNALLLAEGTSKTAASALPGAGIALAAVNMTFSAVKTVNQVRALNNLAKAKAATTDPLLTALSGHIKSERTLYARKHLAHTLVNAAATIAATAAVASGVAAPASFIITGAVGGAVSAGTAAFHTWHDRKLGKAREKAGDLMTSGYAMAPLAASNIGVAERAFLHRLRSGYGNELKEAITFLRNFGLAENTIKKLQLAPDEMAIKTLQEVLYTDKVNYKGIQLKQTVKTLSHISGFTALAKRIKTGSIWLERKLRPVPKSEPANTLGASITSKPTLRKSLSLIPPETVNPTSNPRQV